MRWGRRLVGATLVSLLGSSPLAASTFTVTNTADSGAGSLRDAITNANTTPGSTIVFSLPANSILTVLTPLPPITAGVTIDGSGTPGLTLSGGSTSAVTGNRVFFVASGTAAISNLTIANANAIGGAGAIGGDGGGGMGSAGGTVNFNAGGGGGGGGLYGGGGTANFGGGGGGGVSGTGGAGQIGGGGGGGQTAGGASPFADGGNGAASGGGGGGGGGNLGGPPGNGGSAGTGGTAGANADINMNGGVGGNGGATGGGGGFGTNHGAAGGSGGQFGGGGGASGSQQAPGIYDGGAGGKYAGGGGAAVFGNGGAGGFGGGGGGGGSAPGVSFSGSGGQAGFGAGHGGAGLVGGSGGSAFGGAIFVEAGGALTIGAGNSAFSGGNVTAGTGGAGAANGSAAGTDLFLMSGTTTIFNLGAGHQLTFNGSIADDSAASFSGGTGSGAALAVTSGTVTLNGTNTYSGGTTVTGATLVVNGVLGDPVIGAGGVLTGTGSVADTSVLAGGTFAPGNGTPGSSMTIAGNLAFQSGAVYLVQVSTTAASFATVTGTATLGGTVQAMLASGSYVTKQYDILHSAGLGGTSFTGVTTNLPGVAASLSYSATDVFLNLNSTIGAGGGVGSGQQGVATAINNFFNSGGALPAAFQSLFFLSGANLSNALTQLSGELGTSSQQTTFNAMGEFMGLLTDPFMGRGNGFGGAASTTGYAEESASAYAASRKPANGAAQASDSALVTASAEMKWINDWSAAATFEGEFSNVTRSYAAKGVVRYAW